MVLNIGLSFELETRGQAVLKKQDKPEKGYKCEYVTNVRLLAGGEGWSIGDSVTVTMEGAEYRITVTETTSKQVLANLGKATYTTPVDGESIVQAHDILEGLRAQIEAVTFGMAAKIVGNKYLH